MSKRMRISAAFISAVFLFIFLTAKVYAIDTDNSGFEMESISYMGQFDNDFTISDKENVGTNIKSFDVSRLGNIIICLCNNSVNVYNKSGMFEYAVNYHIDGDSFAFWLGEEVAIYLVRGGLIITLDNTGIKNILDVKNTYDNHMREIELMERREIKNDSAVYQLTFSSSFQKTIVMDPTRCIMKNNNGTYVVYENNNATLNAIAKMLVFLLLVIVWFMIMYNSLKKRKSEE